MRTRPLQYESLKAVLLYLDANVRFQISHRLPAIRITEKVVPLRVRQFEFQSFETTINKTTYKLGVCQRWTPGKRVPANVKFWNSIGVVGHDLDQYGLEHDPGNTVLYEGDVSFCGKYPEYPWDMEERELELREQLRKLEHRMAPKIRSNVSGRKRNDIEELASRIDDIRISLIPFNCRRGNRRPPYVCYLQLTILCGRRRIKKIQRYGYTKKLHEAMKDLNNMLFGGRRAPIQIPEYLPPCSCPIARLPVGFKMKTKYLTMEYVEFLRRKYDPVMSMLDDSCFPLNSVFVTDHINVEYHGRFPEIDNARKLVISIIIMKMRTCWL
ncbi:hypothetical protein CRE_22638 [Caenorhabditis remanei]|uniref:Uncharacterized protein n=1 Tax=Caenorhabditis remanei TaxID=31234 RepID=E3N8P7_CAERE|nr:hypothetical protein CRE_22638 [Caenorhabditis remanei]